MASPSVVVSNELQMLCTTAYNYAVRRIETGIPALTSFEAQRLLTTLHSYLATYTDTDMVSQAILDVSFALGESSPLSRRISSTSRPAYLPSAKELSNPAFRSFWVLYRQLVDQAIAHYKTGVIPNTAFNTMFDMINNAHYAVVQPYTAMCPVYEIANNILVMCFFSLTYILGSHNIVPPYIGDTERKNFNISAATKYMLQWMANYLTPDCEEATIRKALSLM